MSQKTNVTENKAKKIPTCNFFFESPQFFLKCEFLQTLLENLKIFSFHLRNFISKTKNVRNYKRHWNGAMYDPKEKKISPKKFVRNFFQKARAYGWKIYYVTRKLPLFWTKTIFLDQTYKGNWKLSFSTHSWCSWLWLKK